MCEHPIAGAAVPATTSPYAVSGPASLIAQRTKGFSSLLGPPEALLAADLASIVPETVSLPQLKPPLPV
jgi:hypothetical protein